MMNMKREICGDLRGLEHGLLVCNFPNHEKVGGDEKTIGCYFQKLFTLV